MAFSGPESHPPATNPLPWATAHASPSSLGRRNPRRSRGVARGLFRAVYAVVVIAAGAQSLALIAGGWWLAWMGVR